MLWLSEERRLWMRTRDPLYGVIFQHGGWLRLWGWGIYWRSDLVRPSFSERNGLVRTVRIGPWSFRWLKRGSG